MIGIKRLIDHINNNLFWNKLIKNVVTVLIGNTGATIINFLITVILIRTIGNYQYGIFVLAQQYMNLLDGLINFQSWTGVIKYGSEAIVEKDDNRLAQILKSGFFIDGITAVLGMGGALVILPFASKIMHWDAQTTLLAAIFSAEIVFHIEGTSVGILRIFNRFRLTAIQSISCAVIKLIALVVYIYGFQGTLFGVVIVYVVTDIIKHLMLVVMAFDVLHKKFGIRKVWIASVKNADRTFVKFTLWSNIGATADLPVKYFDVFIISMVSVEAVAVYKVFKQIMSVLSMLTQPISLSIMPQFSELVAKRKLKQAYEYTKKIRKMILIPGIAGVVLSALIGKPIFNVFLGKAYGNYILLFVLLFFLTLLCISNIAVNPLFSSMGLAKEDFIYALLTNVAYLIIAYLLVPYIDVYAVVIAYGIQGLSYIDIKILYIKRYIRESELNRKEAKYK